MANNKTIFVLAIAAVLSLAVFADTEESYYAYAGTNSTLTCSGVSVVNSLGINNTETGCGGGGGCDGDCTPPTMGVLKSQPDRLWVENGFTFGDNKYNVFKYHEETPVIDVEVGKVYPFTATYYENQGVDNIVHFGISVGAENGFSSGRAIQDYTLVDGEWITENSSPDNFAQFNWISHYNTECNADTTQLCKRFVGSVSFNEPAIGVKIMTQAFDGSRNSGDNLFNHGIDVSGQTLNPLPTTQVMSSDKLDPLKTITIGDEYLENQSAGIDEDGNTWNLNEDGFWNIQRVSLSPFVSDNPDKRGSFEFSEKLKYEAMRAQYIN